MSQKSYHKVHSQGGTTILETLAEVFGPVLDRANHGLRVDVVELGGEIPRHLKVINLEFQVRRDTV